MFITFDPRSELLVVVTPLFSLMSLLSQDCPSKNMLSMEYWVSPILYMFADAVATNEPHLANSAVEILEMCAIFGGSEVRSYLNVTISLYVTIVDVATKLHHLL